MDLEINSSSTVNAAAMVQYHEQLAEQWRAIARGRPAHRADFPVDAEWNAGARREPAHRALPIRVGTWVVPVDGTGNFREVVAVGDDWIEYATDDEDPERTSGKRWAEDFRPVDAPAEVWSAPTSTQPVLADWELELPEEPRIDLAQFLVDEKRWPARFTAKNVPLFADAVLARFRKVHGHDPEWDHGWVYRGHADWLLVRDVYEQEMGALAELIAHEGPAR